MIIALLFPIPLPVVTALHNRSSSTLNRLCLRMINPQWSGEKLRRVRTSSEIFGCCQAHVAVLAGVLVLTRRDWRRRTVTPSTGYIFSNAMFCWGPRRPCDRGLPNFKITNVAS